VHVLDDSRATGSPTRLLGSSSREHIRPPTPPPTEIGERRSRSGPALGVVVSTASRADRYGPCGGGLHPLGSEGDVDRVDPAGIGWLGSFLPSEGERTPSRGHHLDEFRPGEGLTSAGGASRLRLKARNSHHTKKRSGPAWLNGAAEQGAEFHWCPAARGGRRPPRLRAFSTRSGTGAPS